MTNSTMPAESIGSPAPVSASFRWEVPNLPTSVQISLDLVDQLEHEVIESFKAVTKRGSEVGGILLGRVAQTDKRVVFVENWEPVACDYSRGPLYLLSEEDKERLRAALQRLKGGPLSAVGFFRSNTRKDLVVDEEDLAIFQEFFPDPKYVFLLVKPFAMKPSAGGFFVWEDGKIPEESRQQFPFRRSELQKSYPQSIVQAGGSAAASAPAAREERGPVVVPKPTIVPPVLKREEPRPGPVIVPPKREEPPVVAREEAVAPPVVTPKREEPAPPPAPPRREERPIGPPVSFKREERPPILPTPKRESRPVPPIVTKREERPPIVPAPPKREERSVPAMTKPPLPPIAPKQEQPPKREERPEVQPVAKAEEPAPAPAAMETTESRAAAAPAPAKVEAAPAPARIEEPVSEATSEPEKRRGSKAWIWIAAVVVVALLVIGYFQFYRPGQTNVATRPPDSPFGLKVERSAGQLLLTWKRDAEIIASAQRAILSISDGDHKEDVDLDLGTLRTGSILYSPITNDVSFRLEVTDLKNGKSLSESLRALAGRPSPLMQQPPLRAATPAETRPQTQPVQTPTPGTPAPAAAQPATPAATFTPPPVEPARTNAPNLVPPPKTESLASRLSVPEPPKVETASQPLPGGRTLPAAAIPAPPTVPPPPAPAKQETPRPPAAQTPAAQPAAAAPKPIERLRIGGQVQEARVISRVQPAYPQLARQARITGVVRVAATVGTDGRVKRARAVSGPPLLRQAAVDAVQRWKYAPGTLNGDPVEVTTEVDVTFTLGGR